MEWIETTGKTLNDALDLALDRLGIHKDELEYEVLDEGKKEFLELEVLRLELNQESNQYLEKNQKIEKLEEALEKLPRKKILYAQ